MQEPVAAISVAQYCPPPSTIASPSSFRSETRVKQGEKAFQTVKRFRLSEKGKNAELRRLYQAYEACRKNTDEALAKRYAEEEKRRQAASNVLTGGL